jgi:hypothetical protein
VLRTVFEQVMDDLLYRLRLQVSSMRPARHVLTADGFGAIFHAVETFPAWSTGARDEDSMASVRMVTFAQINELLSGAIDMHVHFGPDPHLPRRVDFISAAQQAQEAGMRAIVLKSHSYPTAPCAHAARQAAPALEVIASICLDEEIGGLNVHALETSAALGAKIAWMPTFSAANSIRKISTALGLELKSNGIRIIDADGQLVPKAVECLHCIHKHDMVLATGHLSPPEIFALMAECERIGHTKIVITHALEVNVLEQALTVDQMIDLARRGAFIEHCMLTCLPAHKRPLNPPEMIEVMRAIGPERCVCGTDLGVAYHPAPAEGMRMFISTMLRHGLSEEDVRQMVQTNAARLLGLDRTEHRDGSRSEAIKGGSK